MNPNTRARLIAAISIGILLGVALYFQQGRQLLEGRAQFIAEQGIRYDKLLLSSHSIVFAAIAATALVCIAVGIYELVVGIVKKIMSLIQSAAGTDVR
jgi:uncharacterized membrane protein YqhA